MRTIAAPTSILLAALGLSPIAFSAVTTYPDAAAFQSTLAAGSYLEGFSSLSAGIELPSTLAFSGNGYSFDVVSSDSSTLWAGTGDTGSQFLGVFHYTNSLTLNFTVGAPTAVGGTFMTTSASDNYSIGAITLTLDDGTSYSYTSPTASDWLYVGFTSDTPINSMTFTTSTPTDAFVSMDNVVVGKVAIPEPSTYAFGAGVLALGFAVWRRHRR